MIIPEICPSYYQVADMTLAMHTDLPITSETFAGKIAPFRVANPSVDTVRINHHFSIPGAIPKASDGKVYFHRENSWTVFSTGEKWVYDGHLDFSSGPYHFIHGEWAADYSLGDIYHIDAKKWHTGGNEALTLMTTDQILLSELLVNRQGLLVHSAGMELWGQGFLFVGHSSAGKSTTVTMLREQGTILCDDRIALRKMNDGFQIYGTWHHGTVSDVSPNSAPLRAICFIEQSDSNRAIPLTDKHEVLRRLLPCLVKPLVTRDWWEKTLATVEQLVQTVPAYRLQRDLSGQIVDVLRHL